ncbi:DUF3149 domain-containing protein [Thiomonas sp.]|jgi:hypothetical protein|uniref:DUF3149 domain-containing protein n=1 Tax=Thiomonas sp. TaxID=2047785 RepID=UPI0026112830|nr:DUF3149 domain-containing protein [Thiomonas sp.]
MNSGSVWAGLFGTDYGLLSLGVIVFLIGMGVFFIWFFIRKIQQSTDEHARELRLGAGKPPVNNGHA